jgi:hypothetical protein
LAHGEKEKDSQGFDNQTVAGKLVGSRQKSCEDFLHSTFDWVGKKRKTLKDLTIKLLPAS